MIQCAMEDGNLNNETICNQKAYLHMVEPKGCLRKGHNCFHDVLLGALSLGGLHPTTSLVN